MNPAPLKYFYSDLHYGCYKAFLISHMVPVTNIDTSH